MENRPSRRDTLRSLGALGLIGFGGSTALSQVDQKAVDDNADFTFAHLTDMHVTARRKGDVGYRACIDHLNANPNRPELALIGGDMAFDGLYTDRQIFERDIELYRSITSSLTMPALHCLGNHDVLGLSSRRKVPVDDPEIGKTMIMKRLGLERDYYSLDHKGWHFVILNSIFQTQADTGPSHEPRIGEEQLHWLARDLGQAGDKPKIVVTHIAAFWNGGQIAGDTEAKAMNAGMVLRDNKDLRRVLERHKVKALLQGHSHTIENYLYNGVWYLTSPAVSSAWWGGTWTGSSPSYTIFKCKGEQLSWEYVDFGWAIQRDPEDELEVKKQAEYDADLAEQARLFEEERSSR